MEVAKNVKKGFTLLELLLVIAIIAILAGLIIFNLNPAQRLRDSNDAKVRSDVSAVAGAIGLYVTDRSGSFGGVVLPRTLRNITFAAAASVNLTSLKTAGFIQTMPTAPTGQQYRIIRSNNNVTVCGTLNNTASHNRTPGGYCVTR
ncbi:prepilin-type N-terminal cleavage/methylation domain-containing protein [Candidatus Dojkabacteria bacterium]|nr:prepilin-type N-terminal cleavage/methylation domain-containing protein [Candidatus Dojkabacteria bacterium]